MGFVPATPAAIVLAVADGQRRAIGVAQEPVTSVPAFTVALVPSLRKRLTASRPIPVDEDVVERATETHAPVPIDAVLRHLVVATSLTSLPVPTKVPRQRRHTTVIPIRDARRSTSVELRGRKATRAAMTKTVILSPARQGRVILPLPTRLKEGMTGLTARLMTTKASAGYQVARRPFPYAEVAAALIVPASLVAVPARIGHPPRYLMLC